MKITITCLLVLLVLTNVALGVYVYRLTGEIDTLGEQIETIQSEVSDRVETLSDVLEVHQKDMADRLDAIVEQAQKDYDRMVVIEEEVEESLAGVEENSAWISGLQTEFTGLVTELAQVQEESWFKADEVYSAVSRSVIEVSNGQSTIGSGFVYDDQGHVVTAHHVIKELADIYVVFPDGRVSPASLIGSSDFSDVAVLKLERTIDVAPLEIAESDALVVGEPVMTIGSPFDLGGTVTAGIISQVDRFRGIGDEEESSWIANLVQFDAPANFGNSGGPLFNADGLVAGLIIARVEPASGEGVSYAVSSNKVRRVTDAIIEQGSFDYPWMGVEVKDLTPEMAEEAGRDSVHGVLVANVVPGGPAWLAGITAGNIITGIDGSSIDSVAELTSYLGEYTSPNDVIVVEVIRDSTLFELEVTLGSR
jgi:S1-C subfamily serine protease